MEPGKRLADEDLANAGLPTFAFSPEKLQHIGVQANRGGDLRGEYPGPSARAPVGLHHFRDQVLQMRKLCLPGYPEAEDQLTVCTGRSAFFQASIPPLTCLAHSMPASCAAMTAMAERSP